MAAELRPLLVGRQRQRQEVARVAVGGVDAEDLAAAGRRARRVALAEQPDLGELELERAPAWRRDVLAIAGAAAAVRARARRLAAPAELVVERDQRGVVAVGQRKRQPEPQRRRMVRAGGDEVALRRLRIVEDVPEQQAE